jgi:DNA-binding transcriptional MerR regulator
LLWCDSDRSPYSRYSFKENFAMLTIGALARATGAKVQTIRYYEEIGLLRAPDRSEGGQRRYDAADRDRLGFIRHARELGFPLDAVRELLDMADHPDRPCAEADALVRRHLGQVRLRIARLRALETELERMIVQCGGDRVADCRVIEVLRDHAECLTDHLSDPDAGPRP